jgi:hypothetical protein
MCNSIDYRMARSAVRKPAVHRQNSLYPAIQSSMPAIKKEHFERAVADVAAHGDNDTLPFDVDIRFVKAKQRELVDVAYSLSCELTKVDVKTARHKIDTASIFQSDFWLPPARADFVL